MRKRLWYAFVLFVLLVAAAPGAASTAPVVTAPPAASPQGIQLNATWVSPDSILPSPGQSATPVPTEVAPLPTPTPLSTSAPGGAETALGALSPITLTVVYDNIPFDERLKTQWGFACLVETGRATVLFDTGADGATLMGNLAALGIDPRKIDRVVLSHLHNDHIGGLNALLDAGDHKTVYAPTSFAAAVKSRVAERAQVVEVSGSAVVTDQIRAVAEAGASEQSLVVETDKGLIVVTGCAHPGIVDMVRQARLYGDVYFAMGGFHLSGRSADELKTMADTLKGLGVQMVAPSHCTGDEAVRQLQAAFGAGFVPAGAGAVIRSADIPLAE